MQAHDYQSDFVLLGGDLFHEHQPSALCYFKASQILNRNVFGTQNVLPNFETQNYPNANYLSGHHSIKLPIFSIHGNHDDPVGLEQLSSLDQLSCNHYINYFGKVTNIEQFTVKPVLLTKGSTRVALFGIGHMKDERLNMAFERGKI